MLKKAVYFTIIISYLFGVSLSAKNIKEIKNIRKNAPNIYIDCNSCDLDYIKTNITFVNYVIDTKEADVYILITRQHTGSGGREYTLEFSGQKKFKGNDDKLICITNQDDTWDKIREKIVKKLKLGLIKYVNKTPLAELITVSFKENLKPIITIDKWKSWVFNINLTGHIMGESSYKRHFLNYSFSAEKVTVKKRFEFHISSNNSKSEFKIGDGQIITSKNTNNRLSIKYIHGIDSHWSAGSFLRIYSSSYRNKKIAYRPSIGIEYNVFPYSISTKKEFRFQYKLGVEKLKYEAETIYDKLEETLFFQNISCELTLKQKWGSVNIEVSGLNYLHDFNKYSIEIDGSVSWRIFKGLSLHMMGGYSIIHNQLYLPKGDLSSEEILLRVSALATNYNYWAGFGFQITFGSIYNNVVNPRF